MTRLDTRSDERILLANSHSAPELGSYGCCDANLAKEETRVRACGDSAHHAPKRKMVIPKTVSICCRHTLVRPM